MSKGSLPEIRLELNSGQFRIPASDAVYVITVRSIGTISKDIEQVIQHELALEQGENMMSEASVQPQASPDIYQTASTYLLEKLNDLASKINAGITGLLPDGGSEESNVNGSHILKEAANALNKAALQGGNSIQNIREKINLIKETTNLIAAEDNNSAKAIEAVQKEIEELHKSATALSTTCATKETPPSQTETATSLYEIEIDVIFQTLYEFCTNEAVKKHLKAIRSDKAAFDKQHFLTTLNESLRTITIQDRVADVQIVSILNSLSQATGNEKYKGFLKKLETNIPSLFLEATLPVEFTITNQTPKQGSASPASEQSGVSSAAMGELKKCISAIKIDPSILSRLQTGYIISKDKKDLIAKTIGNTETYLPFIEGFIALIKDSYPQLLQELAGFSDKIKGEKDDDDTLSFDIGEIPEQPAAAAGGDEKIEPVEPKQVSNDEAEAIMADIWAANNNEAESVQPAPANPKKEESADSQTGGSVLDQDMINKLLEDAGF
ncbi:MAG: hypothetical protein V1753_00315 [Pseudomonadota bacterium]